MKKKVTILFFIFFLLTINLNLFGFIDNPNVLKLSTVENFSIYPKDAVISWNMSGVAICTETAGQIEQSICPDANGGAFIVWSDNRIGSSNTGIYIQRIASNGTILWGSNGTPLCNTGRDCSNPELYPDGLGGAIIAWQYSGIASAYDIYAQRIDPNGTTLWTANGTAISTYSSNQDNPQIRPDGSGGAIITWEDYRSTTNYDIYAQRINATGSVQWTTNGMSICNSSDEQQFPRICADGLGGAIIIWRHSTSPDFDIYAQRINSTGNITWTFNGIPICNTGDNQQFFEIYNNELGGAIITWQDQRGPTRDIYAQRINSSGVAQWTENGTAVCTGNLDQYYPQICSDGANGSIITWYDYRSGISPDIYAQRIDQSGSDLWNSNGIPVCTEINEQWYPRICSDGFGGAIITWYDYRNSSDSDIYAQKIDSNGNLLWSPNGTLVCNQLGHQSSSRICSDGSGGAFIIWQDFRVVDGDIYAQHVIHVQTPINIEILLLLALGTHQPQGSGFLLIVIGIAAATIIIVIIVKKK